jgi:hypothetical protein
VPFLFSLSSSPSPADSLHSCTVKTALLNTHLNMSLCYLKLERWKRALETAQLVKKMDEKNVKAAFREAQARIGMGEVNAGTSPSPSHLRTVTDFVFAFALMRSRRTGRKQLEELQKTNPDSAITAALARLDLTSKQSAKTSSTTAAFRAFLFFLLPLHSLFSVSPPSHPCRLPTPSSSTAYPPLSQS